MYGRLHVEWVQLSVMTCQRRRLQRELGTKQVCGVKCVKLIFLSAVWTRLQRPSTRLLVCIHVSLKRSAAVNSISLWCFPPKSPSCTIVAQQLHQHVGFLPPCSVFFFVSGSKSTHCFFPVLDEAYGFVPNEALPLIQARTPDDFRLVLF